MSRKEQKVKEAFKEVYDVLAEMGDSNTNGDLYDTLQANNRLVSLLARLYDQGYTEGELSKIKQD